MSFDAHKSLEEKEMLPDPNLLNSSPRDFESFIDNNLVWKDIVATIRDRVTLLTNELIEASEDKDIYRLQAEIRVWKEAAVLPHYLYEFAKIEQTIKEKEYAEDSEA